MPRVLRPSLLLQRAVRHRVAGNVAGEERTLLQCMEQGAGCPQRWGPVDADAVRTARFYLALLNCQLGRFPQADAHLSQLGLAARLSDGVWAEDAASPLPADFFVRVVDDGLPPALVEALRRALGPESVYWQEHRYDDEEVAFYSHAHRAGDRAHLVDQLVEALRPLLSRAAPEAASSAHLAEWWAHHRRRDQWHGHPLHFDTNERLLRASRGACLQHPAVSSVVYLSDASPRFGPTLVTNQQPHGFGGREWATVVHPRRGRVLFFDGSYLHGALPGRPWLAGPGDAERRLCIMVGWWTSPIEPLPPSDPPEPLMLTDPSARWVRSLGPLPGPGPAPAGRLLEPGATGPIWRDVPTAMQGAPFFGRYFLTHRGQVDEDICR